MHPVPETPETIPLSGRLTSAVVIPVGGYSRMLDDCLAALREQDHPLDEIIVVDDSPGGVLQCPPGVTVLRSSRKGPYAARNLGWRHVDSDVVFFCDVRSRPRPGWVRLVLAELAGDGVVLSGSDVLVTGGDSLAARTAARMQMFRLSNYLGDPFFLPYLPTCDLAVRRSALLQVGGFPEVRSGGDADLCWQVLRATRGRLAPVESIEMDWIPRDAVKDHLEQLYRYGRSHHQLRSRWSSAGLDVPVPRPWWRIGARTMRAAGRFVVALVVARRTGRADAAVEPLADLAWACNEVGYAVEHVGTRRARAWASPPYLSTISG